MNLSALVIVFILVVGSFFQLSILTYLLFIFYSFGSVSLIPNGTIGNLTPGTAAAVILIIKSLGNRKYFHLALTGAFSIRGLGLLSGFTIISLVGAFILPRLLEGTVDVITIQTGQEVSLAPTPANITQSLYLIISYLCSVIFFAQAQEDKYKDVLLKAVLVGGYTIMLTGLLDWGCNAAGLSSLLDPLRTASYAILSSAEVLDAHRVIGLQTEASSYGSIACTFFALLLFLYPIFPKKYHKWKLPLVTAGCCLLAFMSRSSTAYIMLGAIFVFYMLQKSYVITGDGRIEVKSSARKLYVVLFLCFLCLVLFATNSSILKDLIDLVDTVIFQKSGSASYIERSHWTSVAANAFLGTYGAGVGFGSVRTSNFFVNIFASTGILGGSVFLIFLIKTILRKAYRDNIPTYLIIVRTKQALVISLIGLFVSGTTPDFGIINGILLGTITGLNNDSGVKK